MKRRKIIGLALMIGTLVYLFAAILALYQNQRVKIEKGMEEALKAYAQKDGLDIKELSKDFNLLLDEKVVDKKKINKLDYIFYYCSIFLGTVVTIMTFLWYVI